MQTALNESGEISVRIALNAMGGASIWAGSNNASRGGGGGGGGSIIYDTVFDALIGSGTSINESGRIVWNESFSSPDGIYGSDIDGSNAGIITNRPLGASSWRTARIADSGTIVYRAAFSGAGNALVFLTDNSDTIFLAETGVDFLSPYSFIFTHDFNNAHQTAVKVRIGPGTGDSRPDEIRLFETDGGSILLAADVDADSKSMFDRFDNSVALNDMGEAAFVSTLISGDRGVFRTDGTTITTIATEADTDVSNIEFFAPDINDSGVVVFRAFDGAGLRTIFAGNGDWLVRVVTENDILPSDQGDARVDQETSSSPVFGGGPTINNAGMVAFTCGLTPPMDNQIEWGTGVYVASADIGTLCFGDCDGSKIGRAHV